MKLVPITEWLPHYQKQGLRLDVIAGIGLAGLLIPEAMGYAGIAGLPPQAGLYATMCGLVAYAIFGTSRQMVVSPTSASSAILAATVAPLAASDPQKYMVLASAVTLVLGGLFLLAGILKLGFISDFISKPVLKGFVFGVALSILIKQIPKFIGIAGGKGPAYRHLLHIIRHVLEANLWTLVVGVVALAVLFLVDRFLPRVPGALAVLVGGIAASSLLGLHEHGVHIVGDIPAGLPMPGFPILTWADWLQVAPASAGLALVIFAESIGAARTFANKNGYDIDADQELKALGLANAASAIFRGMQVGGGTSGTAANDANGAQSQISTIAASATVAMTLLFLTRYFYHLPETVLAAIVMHAVWHLLDYRAIAHFRRISKLEFRTALVAVTGVVCLDILDGLVLAVILALITLMRFLLMPQVVVLGRLPATGEYAEVARHPEAEQFSGVLMLRVDRIWFFANANGIRDHVKQLIRDAAGPLRCVIVNLAPVSMIDVTATEVLAQLHASSVKHERRLVLAGVRDPVRETLQRAGLIEALGEKNIFRSMAQAVEAVTAPQTAV
jgi:high affinity sulfate transporter 1